LIWGYDLNFARLFLVDEFLVVLAESMKGEFQEGFEEVYKKSGTMVQNSFILGTYNYHRLLVFDPLHFPFSFDYEIHVHDSFDDYLSLIFGRPLFLLDFSSFAHEQFFTMPK
jgi:hypothetical protein